MGSEHGDCWFAYCIPARLTLGIMAFLMFFVTQMMSISLYIVIVPINKERMHNATHALENVDDWNQNAPGLLLSALYWGSWVTELPGGLLAQKFGGRRVLACCVTLAGLLNLALPFAIDVHYVLAAVIRALQGIAMGGTWPAMHWLSARWIPSTERSKFMSAYHGSAISNAVTYPLAGLIISYLGWRWVFYSTSIATFLWSLAWLLYVYDSPTVHPRITKNEAKYLRETIGDLVPRKGKISTPWKKILNSRPFWAVLIATQGLMWGTITTTQQTPQYFNHMHHLDIKTIGFFSGVPGICKFIFSLTFSCIIDKLLETKKITLTVARKLAISVCEFLPAILVSCLAFYGSMDVNLSLGILAVASAVGGASSSGSMSNMVDLSPNHAGTILGLIKTLTILPGVISPLVVAYLTRTEVDPTTGWRHVWLLSAFIYAVCWASFQICGSGEVQPWNEADKPVNTNDTKPLNVPDKPERDNFAEDNV